MPFLRNLFRQPVQARPAIDPETARRIAEADAQADALFGPRRDAPAQPVQPAPTLRVPVQPPAPVQVAPVQSGVIPQGYGAQLDPLLAELKRQNGYR
jgi:hypothetical protein